MVERFRKNAKARTIAVASRKGGVGKTTYMYHIAHLLARKERKVLMVDCDSQCNLTSCAMLLAYLRPKLAENIDLTIYSEFELLVTGAFVPEEMHPVEHSAALRSPFTDFLSDVYLLVQVATQIGCFRDLFDG